MKAVALQDCIKDAERKSLVERQAMAKAARVSLARAPRVFCRRVVDAVASGEITYSDLMTMNDATVERIFRRQ